MTWIKRQFEGERVRPTYHDKSFWLALDTCELLLPRLVRVFGCVHLVQEIVVTTKCNKACRDARKPWCECGCGGEFHRAGRQTGDVETGTMAIVNHRYPGISIRVMT